MTNPPWDSLQLVSEPTILGTHSTAMSNETLSFAAISDEPLAENVEDERHRFELLLQTCSTELNHRFEQFEARQSQLETKLADSFERTRRNLYRIEQLLSMTETHPPPDPYATQYYSSNPNPYGYEYYHGYSYPYAYQVCAYQVDYSNSGFYFVQFGDGSVVSMTAAVLNELLNSSNGYFENKTMEAELLSVSSAGNREDEGNILARREPDSSTGKLRNWVEDFPKGSEGENENKVFVESSLTIDDCESPPILHKRTPNSDVSEPSDRDEGSLIKMEDEMEMRVEDKEKNLGKDADQLFDNFPDRNSTDIAHANNYAGEYKLGVSCQAFLIRIQSREMGDVKVVASEIECGIKAGDSSHVGDIFDNNFHGNVNQSLNQFVCNQPHLILPGYQDCLVPTAAMKIARIEDFTENTLKLGTQSNPSPTESFKISGKKDGTRVINGRIWWRQSVFSLDNCNLFDTGQIRQQLVPVPSSKISSHADFNLSIDNTFGRCFMNNFCCQVQKTVWTKIVNLEYYSLALHAPNALVHLPHNTVFNIYIVSIDTIGSVILQTDQNHISSVDYIGLTGYLQEVVKVVIEMHMQSEWAAYVAMLFQFFLTGYSADSGSFRSWVILFGPISYNWCKELYHLSVLANPSSAVHFGNFSNQSFVEGSELAKPLSVEISSICKWFDTGQRLKVVDGVSTVFFLDNPVHHYFEFSSPGAGSKASSKSLPKDGATILVLHSVAPLDILSTSSSSKLIELLTPSQFDQPCTILMIEDEQKGDAECSDKQLSDVVSWPSRSYLSKGLTVYLRNEPSLGFQLAKKVDGEFMTTLVSRNCNMVLKMHQNLFGGVLHPVDLSTGGCVGLKDPRKFYGAEGLAEGAILSCIVISKMFETLNAAYQGYLTKAFEVVRVKFKQTWLRGNGVLFQFLQFSYGGTRLSLDSVTMWWILCRWSSTLIYSLHLDLLKELVREDWLYNEKMGSDLPEATVLRYNNGGIRNITDLSNGLLFNLKVRGMTNILSLQILSDLQWSYSKKVCKGYVCLIFWKLKMKAAASAHELVGNLSIVSLSLTRDIEKKIGKRILIFDPGGGSLLDKSS